MPSKKDVQKRRLAAEQAAEVRAQGANARERHKRRRNVLIGGFLAVALVIPLAAGLIALLDSDGGSDTQVEVANDVGPAPIRPIPEGAALTGPTPCPATDGTEVRTTSFEQPPELCIDPDIDYEVVLTTELGPITVTVDPSLDEEAANLFVTLARYGLYDDMPFSVLVPQGLAVSGDPGELDPGFTVTATAPTVSYEVGSVVMFADLPETIASRFAFITTPAIAEVLTDEPIHPVIGTVTAGAEAVDTIIAVGSSLDTTPLPIADIRIVTATVTEVG